MRPSLRVPLQLGAAGASLGAAALAYATGFEVRSFRLRRLQVPVLPAGQRPLRVLHVSDLHLRPGQNRKREWVRRLAGLEPDLVVNTGDNLASPDAVPYVLDALGHLLDKPGVFVLGSNDYFAPRPKNPLRYLLPDDGWRPTAGFLPWSDLRDGLSASGWTDLGNRRDWLKADGREIEFVGVDDPHISRDRYDHVAGPADTEADLAMGVVHAPYRRVLDRMAADGFRLILAGHTHGGQLRVPGYGALVTNCDLPREQARGLSWWPPEEEPQPDRDPSASADRSGGSQARVMLHVSAGLGCSPWAPFRFACPPEATLLTLVARD